MKSTVAVTTIHSYHTTKKNAVTSALVTGSSASNSFTADLNELVYRQRGCGKHRGLFLIIFLPHTCVSCFIDSALRRHTRSINLNEKKAYRPCHKRIYGVKMEKNNRRNGNPSISKVAIEIKNSFRFLCMLQFRL